MIKENSLFAVLVLALLLNSITYSQEIPNLPDPSNGFHAQMLFTKIKSSAFLDDMEAVASQRIRIKEIDTQVDQQCNEVPRTSERTKLMLAIIAKGLHEIYHDVLLPPQQKRFVQLVHQGDLRRRGGSLANYLALPKMRGMFMISKKEVEGLDKINKEKVAEIRKAAEEFKEKVAKLLAEEEKEALRLLNDNQKALVKNLIGDRNVVVTPGAEAKIHLDRILHEK